MNISIFPKKLKIIFLLILVVAIGLMPKVNAVDNANAGSWINQTDAFRYDGEIVGGHNCRINVYNQRSGKWCAGVYNASWKDFVTYTDNTGTDWRIGDTVTVYAYTCYTYGWARVYENGSLKYDTYNVESEAQRKNLEWRIFDYKLNARNTKFTCTAGGGSPGARFEQLGVTIVADGDNEAPKVQCNSTVLVNNNINLKLTDNIGVVGYIVKTNSSSPNINSSWTRITASTNTTKTYKPASAGIYYVWAIDAANNISARASFEAGYLPVLSGPSDVKIKERRNSNLHCWSFFRYYSNYRISMV